LWRAPSWQRYAVTVKKQSTKQRCGYYAVPATLNIKILLDKNQVTFRIKKCFTSTALPLLFLASP
jgi:hypothetical protein